jgi:hypothetical protein
MFSLDYPIMITSKIRNFFSLKILISILKELVYLKKLDQVNTLFASRVLFHHLQRCYEKEYITSSNRICIYLFKKFYKNGPSTCSTVGKVHFFSLLFCPYLRKQSCFFPWINPGG